MLIKSPTFRYFAALLSLVFACSASMAQNKIFTYQGSLTDGTTAANGTYQMQFRLYDAENGAKCCKLSAMMR